MQNKTSFKAWTPAKPKRLMNRSFFLLWQGQLVSQIGTQAFSIAMVFWIKQATGSATLMGLLMMLSNLPAVVLGPLAGTFADRHSRRTILIVCDILSGLSVLTLAALMFLNPTATEFILALMFIASIAVATLAAFFRPAISAAIPDIVPTDKVAAANAMNQGSVQIATFIGQGLGGILYRLLGAPVLFLIDGLSYLFSAFSETFIKIPQKLPEKNGNWKTLFSEFKRDTLEGFRYVWHKPGLRNFFLMAALLNFFTVPFIVLLPFYIEDFLNVQVDWYGYLLAAFGAGALLGYAFAGGFKMSGRVRSTVILSMLIAFSGVFIYLGVVLHPFTALIVLFVTGIMSGFMNINVATILQLTTPSEIRGRVFGLLHTVSLSISPIAMGLSGVVADLLDQNVPLIYIISGIFVGLIAIWMSMNRGFREFLAYEPPDEDEPAAATV